MQIWDFATGECLASNLGGLPKEFSNLELHNSTGLESDSNDDVGVLMCTDASTSVAISGRFADKAYRTEGKDIHIYAHMVAQ